MQNESSPQNHTKSARKVNLPMVGAVSLVFGCQAADELAVVPLGRRHLSRQPPRLGVVGFFLVFIAVVLVVRFDWV